MKAFSYSRAEQLARAARYAMGWVLASTLIVAGFAGEAGAVNQASKAEAAKHFQRGAELYNEGDYQSALIEFERANKLAPNPRVLYNIGQAHYQLQRYADALRTLNRYVAEVGARGQYYDQARSTISVLQSRVGWLDVSSSVNGAEVAVDDRVVGYTPLTRPVLVGIGRRKVTASVKGGVPITRYAEVAAGEKVPVSFSFPTASAAAKQLSRLGASATADDTPGSGRKIAGIALWATSGAMAAAAIVTGVLALKKNSDLDSQRQELGTTRDELDSTSSQTKSFAIATDVLIGAALASAGVALYLTLTGPDDDEREASADAPVLRSEGSPRPEVSLGLQPTGAQLRVSW